MAKKPKEDNKEDVKEETAKPEKMNVKCRRIAEEIKNLLTEKYTDLEEKELIKSVKFCWLMLRDKK